MNTLNTFLKYQSAWAAEDCAMASREVRGGSIRPRDLPDTGGGESPTIPPHPPHPRCPPAPRGLRRVRAGTRRACSSLPWKNVKQKWKELFYNIVRCHGNKYNYRESIYSMLIYMFLIELLPRIHLKGEGRQNHYHIRIRV